MTLLIGIGKKVARILSVLRHVVAPVKGIEDFALPDGLGFQRNQFLVGIRVLDTGVAFFEVGHTFVGFIGTHSTMLLLKKIWLFVRIIQSISYLFGNHLRLFQDRFCG